MIPIIGSGGGEQRSNRTFAPEEDVPESGIYEILHETGERDSIVFLRGSTFPVCEDCGTKVRYRVVRTAPHIFEDKDFK